MKNINNSKYSKYIYEYIKYGLEIGFFDYSMVDEIKNKLSSINIKVDNAIPADASIVGNNLLLVNEHRLKNENITSLVLFHEFTHVLSPNEYSYENNSILYNFKKKYSSNYFLNCKKYYNYKIDLSNYFDYGFILLNEIIAEYIATSMLNKKSGVCSTMRSEKILDNHIINYECDFEYFGFEEHIINLFSKCLKLNENNIFFLSKKIYNENFINDIIYQFVESNKLKNLYIIICYLGILFKYEEYLNGRLLHKIPGRIVYIIYKDLISILNNSIKKSNEKPKLKYKK